MEFWKKQIEDEIHYKHETFIQTNSEAPRYLILSPESKRTLYQSMWFSPIPNNRFKYNGMSICLKHDEESEFIDVA